MTVFDYAVVTVGCVSLLVGVWRGFVREVMALATWAVALWAMVRFGDWGVDAVSLMIEQPWLKILAGHATVLIGVLLIGAGLTAVIRLMVSVSGLGIMDRLLGAMFGLARGGLIAMVAVLLCSFTSLPEKSWWQAAEFAPPLETAVLAARPLLPNDLSSRVRFPLR